MEHVNGQTRVLLCTVELPPHDVHPHGVRYYVYHVGTPALVGAYLLECVSDIKWSVYYDNLNTALLHATGGIKRGF